MQLTIREIKPAEYHLLDDFLYEAIFQKEGNAPLPREIIDEPKMQAYTENFGRKSDKGLVAEVDNTILGCVWTRILAGEIRGYGNIDTQTPEFAISVLKAYRGNGVGYALMQAMLQQLQEKNYHQTSLAVQKENYALELYKKVGFEIITETDEEYIMLCKL